MLDTWVIIEEIRKREEERHQKRPRAYMELPYLPVEEEQEVKEEEPRGVVIIEF